MKNCTRWIVALAVPLILLPHFANGQEVTEQEARQEYDKYYSKTEGQLEYAVRHILVAQREQADAALQRITSGEPFAKVAAEVSQDPGSSGRGGELGWSLAEVYVPEFSRAVRALAPKGLSPLPVRTPFGWHVVEVTDVRERQVPPFESVRERIVEVLRKAKKKEPVPVGVDENPAAANDQDHAATARALLASANQGDATAQYKLGQMYANGRGVPIDAKESIRWYRLAADQGHAKAQHALGVAYNTGSGVSQDDREAAKWYRLAADQGLAWSQFNLGVVYGRGQGVAQDYAESIKWYRLAADQNFAQAQYAMGVMYATGRGVAQSVKSAVPWFRLAAVQGFVNAQSDLGEMYWRGFGVPQDFKEAAKWTRLAAEQGDVDSQGLLGLLYSEGRGVPQDEKEAVKWYRLAADKGHASSQSNLGINYLRGSGVEQSYERALHWLRLAADQGIARAQSNLATMYYNGDGVAANLVVAYALYNVSAARDPTLKTTAVNRENLAKRLSDKEIAAAQDLAQELSKPKNLLAALDRYLR